MKGVKRLNDWTLARIPLTGGVALAVALMTATAGAADPARVEWDAHWPRFRLTEGIATGALAAQAATAFLLYPVPKHLWRGGILFDELVRDGSRLHARRDREAVRLVSDVLYEGLAVYPFIVDTAIVTWGIHGSSDVALQMLAMNAESYALTGALTLTAQKLGRERPVARGCREDADYSPKCGGSAITESFFSGHTAIAFTSAGLTCAHHRHLPLYGGGAADATACVASLTGATAEGVFRLMTDDHYASDVLLGAFVGLLSGYALPSWLHYGSGEERETAGWLPALRTQAAGVPVRGLLAPSVGANYVGFALVGWY